MANKEFKIQSDTISLNGVPLSSSADGKVVIPGITRATGYIADEVEDYSDDENVYSSGTVTAIDQYTYLVYMGQQTAPNGWTPATYQVVLEDDNKIDEIVITSPGAGYPEAAVVINTDNIIISPSGASVAQVDFNPSGDWSASTFWVKMKAASIESDLGGGGGNTGSITFEGVSIVGAGTASGDGNGYGTIELVPDETLYENDQYLIIDPTSPGHIHIRAGGEQDASNADLMLGGEKNHVRVNDGSGVRLQNERVAENFYYYDSATSFTAGGWYQENGNYYLEFTTTDPAMINNFWEFTNGGQNRLVLNQNDTVEYAGWAGSQGNDVYKVQVNTAPLIGVQTVESIEFQLFITQTNYLYVENGDFRVDVYDDIRMFGRDIFRLSNYSPNEPIEITTNYSNNSHTWAFQPDGKLTFPNGGAIEPHGMGWIGLTNGTSGTPVSIAYKNTGVESPLGLAEIMLTGSGTTGSINFYTNNTDTSSSHSWSFDQDGKLTYPNGTTTSGNGVSVPVDLVYELSLNRYPKESGLAGASSDTDNLFVDITEVDDIIAVQAGWQINSGTTQSPIWQSVTEVSTVGSDYRIVVPGFGFTPGTVYTFRNPTSVESVWQFDEFGNLITPGSGSISHINNDLILEVINTDVIVLRTSGGELILGADGSLEIPGTLTLPNNNRITTGGDLNSNSINFSLPDPITNEQTFEFAFDASYGYPVLRFPDDSLQTTAWTGGRVRDTVPAHSYGEAGDQEGDLAFNSGYIYYCTADFTTHETAITVNSDQWGGAGGGLTSLPFSSVRAPQIGWTINITFNSGPATLTVTGVTSLGGDRYQVDFNSVGDLNVSNGNTGTLVDDLPIADIWKRVAWSGDTW